MSQTQSIPSWPPVATICCWLGCLSTQYKGTLSPDLFRRNYIRQRKEKEDPKGKIKTYTSGSYKDRICEGELLCSLRSHSFSCPMEFTVKTSVVLRYVTARIVLLSAFSGGPKRNKLTWFYSCSVKYSGLVLTYDSNHSFLVGSENDNLAILADCDDFRTAADDSGARSIVTGVVMSPFPELTHWDGLRGKMPISKKNVIYYM